ncbi:hypothetical protein CEXT_101971 [Caerostris extrusa]|uniref:Uncharacterized protein n=1 Tax=Caerostris extrusa TaxID=172846 RepID=A0AAV4YA60_CAEEX|nr:hypothetical protein CEXT_101971 [Caerostris extrusa]
MLSHLANENKKGKGASKSEISVDFLSDHSHIPALLTQSMSQPGAQPNSDQKVHCCEIELHQQHKRCGLLQCLWHSTHSLKIKVGSLLQWQNE